MINCSQEIEPTKKNKIIVQVPTKWLESTVLEMDFFRPKLDTSEKLVGLKMISY